jgi:hypothetical protein
MKPNKKAALGDNKGDFNKEKMQINHSTGNGGGNPSGLRVNPHMAFVLEELAQKGGSNNGAIA